jgi:rare lipoprotein A
MRKPPKSSFFPLFIAMLSILVMIAPNSHAGSRRTLRKSSKSKVHSGETLTGKATYYPSRLNGHKTSSGEVFRQNENTAASNKLPLGTDVKVTNLKNGESADVTVIDHGAKLGSHKIDLSKKAANEIGLTRKEGTVPVKMKVTQTAEDSKAP